MRQGKTTLIKKDGGENAHCHRLEKPLSEAQGLVDDPDESHSLHDQDQLQEH